MVVGKSFFLKRKELIENQHVGVLWNPEKAVVAGSGRGWRVGSGSCRGINRGKS